MLRDHQKDRCTARPSRAKYCPVRCRLRREYSPARLYVVEDYINPCAEYSAVLGVEDFRVFGLSNFERVGRIDFSSDEMAQQGLNEIHKSLMLPTVL
eukprot:1192199-Prorocentrum_minimum.AAC.2